jgi:hypothetical protein
VNVGQPLPALVDAGDTSKRGRSADGRFRRRVAVHGITVEIDAPPALAPALAIVLRAYSEATMRADPDLRITVARVGQRWRVATEEGRYPEIAGAGSAARLVEWILVAEALRRWPHLVHVHAALVATPDRSALLIGRSGSGKSTTSIALALTGLALYTDDVALIDRETLQPVCLPRPVKLDQRSRRLLRPRGLVIPRGTSLGESIDRTVLPGLPPIEDPGPRVAAAIFFAAGRRDQAEVRPLSQAEAVMRLSLQSASERFDASGPSDGAVALINAVRCYELVPGDLETTVRAILDLLEGPSGSIAIRAGITDLAGVA